MRSACNSRHSPRDALPGWVPVLGDHDKRGFSHEGLYRPDCRCRVIGFDREDDEVKRHAFERVDRAVHAGEHRLVLAPDACDPHLPVPESVEILVLREGMDPVAGLFEKGREHGAQGAEAGYEDVHGMLPLIAIPACAIPAGSSVQVRVKASAGLSGSIRDGALPAFSWSVLA